MIKQPSKTISVIDGNMTMAFCKDDQGTIVADSHSFGSNLLWVAGNVSYHISAETTYLENGLRTYVDRD